jgi:hypothetical protein
MRTGVFFGLFRKNLMRTGWFCSHEVTNIENHKVFLMNCQHTSAKVMKNIRRTDVRWLMTCKSKENMKGLLMFSTCGLSQILKNTMRTDDCWPHEKAIIMKTLRFSNDMSAYEHQSSEKHKAYWCSMTPLHGQIPKLICRRIREN